LVFPPPFGDHEIAFVLSDVHLEMQSVDLKQHLGTLNIERLDCSERRVVMHGEEGSAPTLEYGFYVQTPGFEEPDDGLEAPVMALIVIGTHDNGCRLQLTGRAYVYADLPNQEIDGVFYELPTISVLSGLPDDEANDNEDALLPDNVVPFDAQQRSEGAA
jgi:hypothetical protein